MQNDPKTQVDGYVSFIGGQDAGKSPSLLAPSQCAELWNTTVRGGIAKPRPGFKQLPFLFPTNEIASWFETKQVQAAIGYRSRNRSPFSVWSVGGRFFTVDIVNGGIVQEITPTGSVTTTANFTIPAIGSSVAVNVSSSDLILTNYPIHIAGAEYQVTSKSGSTLTVTNVNGVPTTVITSGTTVIYLDANAQNKGIVWMVQAEEFLVMQDGASRPLVFDGSVAFRAPMSMPVGTVMAYGIGRLWIAIPGNAFVASDIVRGTSGTDAYGHRDAILYFTENTFLTGGGAFFAPSEIRAMAFMTTLDTSTGQGPLLIFCETCILSVNAPVERELWAVVQNPIQTISLLSNGATGFYSTIATVNGDIFYRAIDGLRSFYYALREFGDWGNTPISTEVNNIIVEDDPGLLNFTSAIVFDNRLLLTSEARAYNYGAYFKGLIALDFHTISSMGLKAPPAYDGVWTGIDVLWLFKLNFGRNERAFAAVRNSDNVNELWEITKDSKFDGDDGRIVWRIVSKNFSFQGGVMEMKRLQNTEIWTNGVVGEVDLTLKYRSDEYPCWSDWRNESVCVDYRQCSDAECNLPPTFRPGYKTRISFGQPSDTDETNDGKPARLGYEHQFLLEVEGYCEIRKIRMKAQSVEEEVNPVVS